MQISFKHLHLFLSVHGVEAKDAQKTDSEFKGFWFFFCYLAPHKCVEHSYLSVNSVTPSFIPFNTWQEVEYSFAPYIAYITPTTITQNGTNRLASVNPQPSSCDMTEATCSPPWLCTT